MNRIMDELYNSYDSVFGAKSQMKNIFQYVKTSNWIVKLIFYSIPSLGILALILLWLEKLSIVFAVLIPIILIPYFGGIYIKKNIEESASKELFSYEQKFKEWTAKFENKTNISLDNSAKVLVLEEIVRNEMDSELNKPTFIKKVVVPTKNLIFPLSSFIVGLLISDNVTLDVVSFLLVGVIILFLVVFSFNLLSFNFYEFSRTNKIREILGLVLECKLHSQTP